jgi:hypothetical protein
MRLDPTFPPCTVCTGRARCARARPAGRTSALLTAADGEVAVGRKFRPEPASMGQNHSCRGEPHRARGCIFLPGALDKRGIKRARVPASPPCFGFRLCRACQPARSWGLRRIISIHHICVVGACARAMLSTVLAMLMINALGTIDGITLCSSLQGHPCSHRERTR